MDALDFQKLESYATYDRINKEAVKEIRTLRATIEAKDAEIAEAKKEWRDLATYIANHLDEECLDAEWSDINGSFDPWDCIRTAAADLAEARKKEAEIHEVNCALVRVMSRLDNEPETRGMDFVPPGPCIHESRLAIWKEIAQDAAGEVQVLGARLAEAKEKK